MITRVEALNFRCLKWIQRDLDAFHVLVGPNAIGKTTFCDVIRFLGRLVSGGLDDAVGSFTSNFEDLVWQRRGTCFELAIELRVPDEIMARLSKKAFDTCRYQVVIGVHGAARENAILAEQVLLLARPQVVKSLPRTLFPAIFEPPRGTLLVKTGTTKAWTLAGKSASGNDNYYRETSKGFEPVFKLGPRRSALGGAPEDESGFPVLTWLKRTLVEGVQTLALNSALMRMPSPPGQKRGLRPDGSNLPWVIADLLAKAPARAKDWVDHLQTALPDLLSIRTVERPEDKHRYLVVAYRGGLEAPSWVVSDGTLRLLALTLPAYLPDLRGIYLIEEPENGIHPRAVETMFQSLSSVYDAQVLLATHSPVILSLAGPEQVLCFGRTGEGATDIVRGSEHPALRDWKGDPNLSVLYATGVLG